MIFLGNETTTDFDVTGMSCSACQSAVERAVRKCGACDVSVNLLNGRMKVTHDDSVTDAAIMAAVEEAGYHASKHSAVNPNAIFSKEEDARRLRIRSSVILLVPLMIIAMLPMAPLSPYNLVHSEFWLITSPAVQLILASVILWINRAYFINGFTAIMNRSPNMDTLVAIGSAISLIYSFYTTGTIYGALAAGSREHAIVGLHQLYFDSAAMIVTLITVGKYLEARAKHHTSDAISELLALAPQTAYRVDGDTVTPVATSTLCVNDIVEIRPGGRIPVDGIIVSGSSSIDESAFTGESIPVEKSFGDTVTTGTINTTGAFRFRVTAVGADTALAKIVELVENANATKAPIARTADKVAAVFVPTILTIAIITFIAWMAIGENSVFAIKMAISVIVISCPCALGLATPVAIMVGSGQGAKKGILFKDAAALERLHQIDTFVFDKTGTITEGRPALTDVIPFQGQDKAELLRIAASLEASSEHPLAQAITDAAHANHLVLYPVSDFRAMSGRGISGVISGHTYYAGSQHLMAELGLDLRGADKKAHQLAQEGNTPLYIADEHCVLGLLTCADRIKQQTPRAIQTLRQMDKKLILLSGDHQTTAEAVANRIGVDDVIAEVLPTEKEAVIADLMQKGNVVAMVGDGINDSPALARADVGIAIGAGTDIAIESADVILTSSELTDIAYAYELSGATIKNIHQNLFWAFFYNILCIPLAAGVFYPAFGISLNPMIAAACMSLSSLFVVTNALRLHAWKPTLTQALIHSNDITPAQQPATPLETAPSLQQCTVCIDGMSCNHCKMSVEKGLGALDGVTDVTVSLADKTATVTATTDIHALPLEQTINDLGFTYQGIQDDTERMTTMNKATVHIEGMACNHCKMSVEKGLGALDGVTDVAVSLEDKTATVTATTDINTLPIAQTVTELGFEFKGID